MTAIVELKMLPKSSRMALMRKKIILNDVSLEIFEHDFITILGWKWSRGSQRFLTLLQVPLPLTSGSIRIMGEDVTHFSPEKRAKYLSRVFQDPKMGTAPRMTVAENLLIAKFRGREERTPFLGDFQAIEKSSRLPLKKVGSGLEKHLDTPIEFYRGGQRQALSLLMATLKRPELLLLDEHSSTRPQDQRGFDGVNR